MSFIFILILLLTTSSLAAPIRVNSYNFQAFHGIFMKPYFENANASLISSSVTVNTATSIPETMGSFLISQGTSAYLWTTQFPSATSIPSGKMTLDLWAGPTPVIDGQAADYFRATSGSVSLTTTQANDLIYVVVAIDDTSANVTISGAGLTWISRGSATASTGKVHTFYAISPNALSVVSITATISGREYFVLTAFGISGVDTANPFDSNLLTPVSGSGNSNSPSVSFTTVSNNDLIIGAAYINGTPPTVGTGYTEIAMLSSGSQLVGATEYKNAVEPCSPKVLFSMGTSINFWAVIGDAVVPSSSGAIFSVSAYTTNSIGTTSGTLFSGLNTSSIPAESGQVAMVFTVSPSTIPTSGYIKVVLTAPTSSAVKVYWGNGQPTNFQVCFTYS